MNLRILKKLSKRAAPLLPLLGDPREQFRARKDENYIGRMIRDRTCWDRSRCHPSHTSESLGGGCIVFRTRRGHAVVMCHPSHPLKGTVMVGAVTGYYEPEWDEEDAWSSLCALVACHFTDWEVELASWNSDTPVSSLTRDLSTPSLMLAAAADIVAELADSDARGRANLSILKAQQGSLRGAVA